MQTGTKALIKETSCALNNANKNSAVVASNTLTLQIKLANIVPEASYVATTNVTCALFNSDKNSAATESKESRQLLKPSLKILTSMESFYNEMLMFIG